MKNIQSDYEVLPLQGSDRLRGRDRTNKVYMANILTRLLTLGFIKTGPNAKAMYYQLDSKIPMNTMPTAFCQRGLKGSGETGWLTF